MVMISNKDRMYTASEVASLLNIHINTVRRWSKQGILKTYRVGPRRDRRFKGEDLDNFLNRSREEELQSNQHAEHKTLANEINTILQTPETD
jgi:excisionase family DNA binding protein